VRIDIRSIFPFSAPKNDSLELKNLIIILDDKRPKGAARQRQIGRWTIVEGEKANL